MKYIVIFTFLSLITAVSTKAQVEGQVFASNMTTDKSHQKKAFQDETGRIYWNVELPVYLSISPDPDNASSFAMKKVKNEAMKEHANPMYFDGHGVHYIRHLDYEHHVPENEVAFEVFVDGRKPISKASFTEAPKYSGSGTIYYGRGLKVVVDAKDEMSGVQSVFFSKTGTPFKTYTQSLAFDGEGQQSLSYYSVDNVGNMETSKTHDFIVDLSAPETTISLKGDRVENIVSYRINVTLESDDELSGVDKTVFQFDEGNELTYSKTFNLGLLEDGEHVLTYYSTDHVQNKEEPQHYKFYLDRTSPEVSSEIIGSVHRVKGKAFIAGTSKVRLIATDNKAGVEKIYYSINGKEKQEYNTEFKLEETQGIHNIKFWAADKVNNVSKMKTDADLGNLYLDLTAPKMSHAFTGAKFYTRDTMFITSDTKIKLGAYDAQSGLDRVDYQVDGKTAIKYESPFTLDLDGFHTVDFQSKDMVGNTSNDDFFFVLDNEAPEIFSHLSIDAVGIQKLAGKEKDIPVYPKHAVLYLAATDKQVGTDKIFYSIDGGAEKEYTGPIKTNIAGLWSVKVRALDKLGNEQVNEAFEFVIQ